MGGDCGRIEDWGKIGRKTIAKTNNEEVPLQLARTFQSCRQKDRKRIGRRRVRNKRTKASARGKKKNEDETRGTDTDDETS